MAAPGSKLKSWLGIAASTVGLIAFIWIRVWYLKSHGQPVFWLAELFSPAALFCILVVTFVDKLVAPIGKAKAPRSRKGR